MHDGLQELRGDAVPRAPDPARGPFGEDQVRLKALAVGRTPQASAETKAKFERFIDSRIDTENTLDLVLGRPTLLVLKQPPTRIQIADETIANYTLVTEREVSVMGQTSGTTVLNFWFADAANPDHQEVLSYLVRIMPDPEEKERLEKTYQALETEINRNFPNSVVHLSLVGDRLLIRGQAKDIEDATNILQIVGANAPGGPQNLQPPNTNQQPNNAVINVNPFGGGFLPITETDDGAVNAENYIIQPQTNGRVINMLHVAGQQQVSLKVTVAEVDRSATRAIGADLTLGHVGGVARFLSFGPAGAATTGGTLLINRGDFDLAINALKTMNLARSLAEPNLVTLNGRPAHLQVGGSFPVPILQQSPIGVGLEGVSFVQFGVRLTFIPVITDKNRIRLRMNADVSDPNPSLAADINGTNVPGLTTRNFTSTVELRDGQTLAVAGLLRNDYSAKSSKVPFIGEVPVVGQLFGNSSSTYAERELIFLVTPYLAAPLNEAECLGIPGADIFEPDDIEFYICGRIEGCVSEDYRSAVRTDCQKMKAFRRVQQQVIVGPSGHSDGLY
jgi:pilus assembly protein CpaC